MVILLDSIVASSMADEELESFKQSLLGVRELVNQGVSTLPRFYVQQRKLEAAKRDNSNEVLPVVDLAGVNGSQAERARIVENVRKACEEWGFFHVINHGIPSAVMQKMLAAVEDFFNMPIEERVEYYSNSVQDAVRFGTSHNLSKETVLEWKDYLRHPCLPLEEFFSKWPSKPPSYREATKAYSQAVKRLAAVMLELLSESLGLESDYLTKAFGDTHFQTMQSNYYPPCPEPELTIGISEHSDVGGFTILLQNDVDGLEVYHNGQWLLVRPVEDALVVNLGDHTQVLTNGRYKSVLHRGRVNSEKLRISVATFYQPAKSSLTRPIPELLSAENPAIYKSLTFGEFLENFFKSKLQGKTNIETLKITDS